MKKEKKFTIGSVAAFVATVVVSAVFGDVEGLILTGALVITGLVYAEQYCRYLTTGGKKYSSLPLGMLVVFSVLGMYVFHLYAFIPEVFVWDIYTYTYVIIFLSLLSIFFLKKKRIDIRFIQKISSGILLLPILAILPLWGSQSIWMIPGFIIAGGIALFLFLDLGMGEKTSKEVWITPGAIVVVCLISTFYQFWGLAIQLILGSIVLLTLIAIFVSLWRTKKAKRLEQKQKLEEEEEKREEEKRRKEERKKFLEHEEARIKKLQEAQQTFLQQIQETGEVDWERVYSLKIPMSSVLLLRPILYKVSKEKKELRFYHKAVELLILSFQKIYRDSMDDEIIKKVRAIASGMMSELQQYSDYKGFSLLHKFLHEELSEILRKK